MSISVRPLVFTQYTVKDRRPAGTVHSIEPLVFAHPTWSLLLRPREGPNVVRHSAALGTEQGRNVMSVPVRHGSPVTGRSFLTSGSTGLGSNEEFTDHLEVLVKTDTLDHFVQANGIARVDFVKADVEGAELRVLEGGKDTIDRFKPALLIEIEERHVERFGYHARDVVDFLFDRGYRMSTWQRGRWVGSTAMRRPHPELPVPRVVLEVTQRCARRDAALAPRRH